jgi:hypothetical protein
MRQSTIHNPQSAILRTIGSRYASRRRPSEKPARHQIVDHLATHVRLEPPEPRRLIECQLQAGHLDELRAHASKQRITRAGAAANDLHPRAPFQESGQPDPQPLSCGVSAGQPATASGSEPSISDIVVGTAGVLDTFVGKPSTLDGRFVNESWGTAFGNLLTAVALSLPNASPCSSCARTHARPTAFHRRETTP